MKTQKKSKIKISKINNKVLELLKRNISNRKKINENYLKILDIKKKIQNYLYNYKLLVEANEILKHKKLSEITNIAIEQKNSSITQMKYIIKKIKNKYFKSKKIIKREESVIIEIRAGVGGEEATFFAKTLLKMYIKYSERRGWMVEILYISKNNANNYKEIIVSISGEQVYEDLQFESGVHRVQRIPDTETKGRVHTSTVTIAILPISKNINTNINERDIVIESFKSGGAGGQHINTTDSAIRIRHIPTSIIVTQSQKSQHQNKDQALKILKYKLIKMRTSEQNEKISKLRKIQIKNANRTEKIRTYNYPQNRITDHRIKLTTYNLQLMLQEGMLENFFLSLKNKLKND